MKKSKKLLLASAVALFVNSPFSWAANDPFEFVPTSSPEYNYIQELYKKDSLGSNAAFLLASKGYNLTRYEIGLIATDVAINGYQRQLGEQDKSMLKSLATGYANEISQIMGDSGLVTAIQNIPATDTKENGASGEKLPASNYVPVDLSQFIKPVQPEEPPVPTSSFRPKTTPVSSPVVEDPFENVSKETLDKLLEGTNETAPNESMLIPEITTPIDKIRGKLFQITGQSSIKYVNVKTAGNVPLDDSHLGDDGNPIDPKYVDQREFSHEISVSALWRLNNAIKITTTFLGSNDNGLLWQKGHTFHFGNTILNYKDKTNIIFGTFDASFTSYTFNKSDMKGIMLTHEGDGWTTTAFGSYTEHKKEGASYDVTESGVTSTVTIPGIYDRFVKGFQYTTEKLKKGLTVKVNYATADDLGSLDTPNGTKKESATVWGVAVDGTIDGLQISSEYAKTKNNYDKESGGKSLSDTAFFVNLSKQFNSRLSAAISLVKIGDNYDASTMVQDKEGDFNQYTDNGDGKPDYLYPAGEKTFNINLNYVLKEGISNLALGYTNSEKTGDGNKLNDFYLTGNYAWQFKKSSGDQVAVINLTERYEKRTMNDENQTTIDTNIQSSWQPWDKGLITNNVEFKRDNKDGNEVRTDTEIQHDFKIGEKICITPSIKYTTKKNSLPGVMDVKTITEAIDTKYNIIPEELAVTLRISRENYDVAASEISKETGEQLDGDSRKTNSVGLGINWQPKNIPGLTAAVSYSKEKTDYKDPESPDGNANVVAAKLAYSKNLGDKTNVSVHYDYSSSKDKETPLYDEVVKTVGIDVNTQIGASTTVRLSHSQEKHYKPKDPNASYDVKSTVADVVTKF